MLLITLKMAGIIDTGIVTKDQSEFIAKYIWKSLASQDISYNWATSGEKRKFLITPNKVPGKILLGLDWLINPFMNQEPWKRKILLTQQKRKKK